MTPFDAYDDGFAWPNLYEEIDEMLEACILIYPMADLRSMAREGKIKDPRGTATKLPLTSSEVLGVINANMDALIGTDLDQQESKNSHRIDALHAIQERQMKGGRKAKDRVHLSTTRLVAFDDEFALEELVYAVGVNHQRKRVTVCFRGSVTKTDWATDVEIFMKSVPNRMRKHPGQHQTIKVHNGFHDYLFSPSSRGPKGPNGKELSEYQEILQQCVVPMLKKYPGYKLYVTGHSLGAALCTLFAFEAASEPESLIPKPVTCVSVASPYVGDESFRDAHQLLESLGMLRHLRISNHKDLVTTVPKFSFKFDIFDESAHVGTPFKHVGVNMKLFGGKEPFQITYPKVGAGTLPSYMDELMRGWENSFFSNISWNPKDYWKWPWHSTSKYSRRVERNKILLENMYLNDLYADKNIVGHLLAEF